MNKPTEHNFLLPNNLRFHRDHVYGHQMSQQVKYNLSLQTDNDGVELVLTTIGNDSVGWVKWYQAQHSVTSDAESLGFVKTLSFSIDKYALNELRELHNTVEIDPDRLEQFGFRRFENRQSAS
jgi:hypothetical protein